MDSKKVKIILILWLISSLIFIFTAFKAGQNSYEQTLIKNFPENKKHIMQVIIIRDKKKVFSGTCDALYFRKVSKNSI